MSGGDVSSWRNNSRLPVRTCHRRSGADAVHRSRCGPRQGRRWRRNARADRGVHHQLAVQSPTSIAAGQTVALRFNVKSAQAASNGDVYVVVQNAGGPDVRLDVRDLTFSSGETKAITVNYTARATDRIGTGPDAGSTPWSPHSLGDRLSGTIPVPRGRRQYCRTG